jgi:hypothetical protein
MPAFKKFLPYFVFLVLIAIIIYFVSRPGEKVVSGSFDNTGIIQTCPFEPCYCCTVPNGTKTYIDCNSDCSSYDQTSDPGRRRAFEGCNAEIVKCKTIN